MNGQVEKAIRDLPKLRQFVAKLTAIVEELLSRPIRYRPDDHLAFMALGFTCAQLEHLRAVCTLVDARYHKDAALIARTMFEGLCGLLWAAQKPEDRPLLWRRFSIIDDFRIVDPAVWKANPQAAQELKGKLKKYGPLFYTKEAKQAEKQGKPLPRDPYWRRWSENRPVKDLCEKVKAGILYDHIYKDVSCWIHWSPRGIGRWLEVEDLQVKYKIDAPDMAATALAVGFQSLLETALVLDSRLELGFRKELEELRTRFITELSDQ
jgi:hypothetical protein